LTSLTSTSARRDHSDRGMPIQIFALALLLAACYGAAFLGQLATTPNIPTWYAGLAKPAFNPPNAVFPVAWGILYTVMAVAAWLVWRTPPSRMRTIGLSLFAAQLALNVAWSWAFFGGHSPLGGLIVIVPLLAAIAWTIIAFWRTSRPAAWLMAPYFLWVCFATLLNASILTLN